MTKCEKASPHNYMLDDEPSQPCGRSFDPRCCSLSSALWFHIPIDCFFSYLQDM